jgi:hypothetical protein
MSGIERLKFVMISGYLMHALLERFYEVCMVSLHRAGVFVARQKMFSRKRNVARDKVENAIAR